MILPWILRSGFNRNTPKSEDLEQIVLKKIEEKLIELKVQSVSINEGQINFRSGLFRFVGSWNQLATISSGVIKVRQVGQRLEIAYKVSFLEVFLFVSAAVSFFFGPSIWNAPNLEKGQSLFLLGFAWLWLFGGNFAYGAYRIRKVLAMVVENSIGEIEKSKV